MRLLPLIGALLLMVTPAQAQTLTVFAAASLKGAFDAIAQAFAEETGVDVVLSYAGTSALARQIEQGAPADVFVSANEDWVTYLVERDALDASSVSMFAGNALVLIAPSGTLVDSPPDLTKPDDWLFLLGEEGRLSVALVEAVPAGVYAREAMQALGLWPTLEPRLAQSDNVRAALFLVARGEAPLGIVYASDARAEPRVQVLASIPVEAHSPIRYTAARVAGSASPGAERFLTFLSSSPAQVILQEQGFGPAS